MKNRERASIIYEKLQSYCPYHGHQTSIFSMCMGPKHNQKHHVFPPFWECFKCVKNTKQKALAPFVIKITIVVWYFLGQFMTYDTKRVVKKIDLLLTIII